MLCIFLRRDAGGGASIPQTRAIQMHRQAVLVGEPANTFDFLKRENRAAGQVVRIFQRDQTAARKIISLAAQSRFDLPGGDNAMSAGKRTRLHTAQCRHGAGLVMQKMCTSLADNLIARLRLAMQRNLVAHGAAGNKQCGLGAQKLGHYLLQVIHRWVFTKNIVTHFRFRHGLAHAGGRPGNGIAAQIDQRHVN